MIDFYNTWAKNLVYSQNGEEGILVECLKRIGVEKPLVAEWGANDGSWCSNTAYFMDRGSAGIMVEYEYPLFVKAKERGRPVVHDAVTPENINKYVDREFDIVSMDTDGGNDYRCFQALNIIPKVLVIEINSGFPPHEVIITDHEGCSYKPMVELGIRKGMFLLCHTGNLIFVRNEFRSLFPEISGDGLYNSELYFNKSWL